MKIFLLTQNQVRGYDTYDSCIVCAENKEEAVLIRPDANSWDDPDYSEWATDVKHVKCEEIGVANEYQEEGVILFSYNAG